MTVIEPPVDVDGNAPGAVDVEPFRREHGLGLHDFVVVCVTRLAAELKLEGLLAAVDVAGQLAEHDPALRLVLVGDGPAAPLVRARADEVNRRAGRSVVVLTGANSYGATLVGNGVLLSVGDPIDPLAVSGSLGESSCEMAA